MDSVVFDLSRGPGTVARKMCARKRAQDAVSARRRRGGGGDAKSSRCGETGHCHAKSRE